MARILAAKPHSVDVERIISASNMLKTDHHQHLSIDTENLHLYIHFNMLSLSEWDPLNAVLTSVSYTHLDVYKRQVIGWENRLPTAVKKTK